MKLLDVYGDRERAIQVTYKLLIERPIAANISHGILPSMQEHRRFVASKPYRAWFIAEVNDVAVGAVYATQRNEVGVAVLKEHQRRGHGRQALAILMKKLQPLPAVPAMRPGRFVANVAPANYASRALFESLGGHIVQHTYAL